MARQFTFRAFVIAAIGLVSFALQSRAQMLSCLPAQPCPSIAPDVVLTKADYMRSMVRRWTPLQVSAWQSLDSSFRGWVIDLMWRQQQIKDIERRTGGQLGYDPYFRLDMPSNCPLPAFVPPARNPSDQVFRNKLRSYLIQVPTISPGGRGWPSQTPVDYWNDWEQIEPSFRKDAESEMYEQHYQFLWVRERLTWWQSNWTMINNCIEAPRPRPFTQPQRTLFAAASSLENQQIDDKYNRDIREVRERFAPVQAKPETIDRLQGWKEIEKYEHDMDRSEKPVASPSPSPHNSRIDP